MYHEPEGRAKDTPDNPLFKSQPTHRLAVNCPVLALIVNFTAIAFVSLVRATIGRDDGGETLTETIPSLVTADLAHPLLSFF